MTTKNSEEQDSNYIKVKKAAEHHLNSRGLTQDLRDALGGKHVSDSRLMRLSKKQLIKVIHNLYFTEETGKNFLLHGLKMWPNKKRSAKGGQNGKRETDLESLSKAEKLIKKSPKKNWPSSRSLAIYLKGEGLPASHSWVNNYLKHHIKK